MTLGAVLGDVGITQTRHRPPATTKPQRYGNIIHLSMNQTVSTDDLAVQEARATPTFTDPYHRLSSSLTDSRGHSIAGIDFQTGLLQRTRKASSLDDGSRETVLSTVRLRPHLTNECFAALMERNAAVGVPDPLTPPIASRSRSLSDNYRATWRSRASWSCSTSS